LQTVFSSIDENGHPQVIILLFLHGFNLENLPHRAIAVEIDLMRVDIGDLEVENDIPDVKDNQKEYYALDVLPVIPRHGSSISTKYHRERHGQSSMARIVADDVDHLRIPDQDNNHMLRPNLRETFKTHRVAVLWSLAISASVIMEAYDASLISGLFALPAFAKRFGTQLGNGKWNIE
jgi:hypothetical protein